jgi:crossover junction endodeoxyribonuclease RuvC
VIRILGIDPGARVTGYGVIDSDGRRNRHVADGCIRMEAVALAERLGLIYRGVLEVVDRYGPQAMAVEEVFLSRNPSSALKLGHARAAAICAGVSRALPVAEYSAREVKLAVVGRGGADKAQVQHMVCRLLGLAEAPAADAADALAVALCHAHTRTTRERLAAAVGRAR